MSKTHFFKQLSYTFSRSFILNPSLPPLLSFTPISLITNKPTFVSSSLFKKTPSFSSTYVTAFSNDSTLPSSSDQSFTYLSVRIHCPKHLADMLSEALLCFGANSASMDVEDGNESSNKVYIDSIFYDAQDVESCLSQAADSIGLKQLPAYEVKVEQQCDWIQKTQELFQPVEVAEGLWVVPEWKTPPDARANNIILNPGLAFGTGDHPTTKLCLLQLRSLIKGGELFLDYGTGSGILAIAAIKFGAALSVGFDIEPQAIAAARHNAALNNIGSEMMEVQLVHSKKCTNSTAERTEQAMKDQRSCGTESNTETGKFDVVLANILLNPLLELADVIVSYAKPGAAVGLSGIISEQVPRLVDRYSALLEDISVSEMDGWACVSGRKRANLSRS